MTVDEYLAEIDDIIKDLKICCQCKVIKEITHFHKDVSCSNDLRARCKKCEVKRVCNYAKRFPGKVAASCSKRRAFKINATPSWSNLEEIKDFYVLAKTLTDFTGIPHEVDHIVPLNHADVCGLHVPANLQVICKSDNRKKNNKFDYTHDNMSWETA